MSRSAVCLALLSLTLTAPACDKVPLLAPTGSTVTLSISSTNVGSNGTAELVATVIEAAGTPVHDGTEVTFQASVGRVDPPVARTERGLARTRFLGNGASGTANITAFSGGATSEAVEVRVGSAAAETVSVRTSPSSVPSTGGTVQVIATVRDISGNPLPGAQVVFSSDNGTLAQGNAVSDANGEATTTLTTNRQTTVRANVAGKEGTATVSVVTPPTATITVSPTTPIAGSPVTITVTPGTSTTANPIQNVIVDFGDGEQPANLGAINGATPVSHVYRRGGTYTITVTLVDSDGTRTSFSMPVTVQDAVVAVSFTSAPPSALVGQAVTMLVAVANANQIPITGVSVDWGDGTASTSLAPTGGSAQHVYTTPRQYTITATATDVAGNRYQATHSLRVQ